jgi:predicted RNase H-like HicB family nuclease
MVILDCFLILDRYYAQPVNSSFRKVLVWNRVLPMQVVKFVCWEEEGAWLGYLQDYPDYWTQGKTLEDLKKHLKDLYQDLTSGEIPGIRRVEELILP